MDKELTLYQFMYLTQAYMFAEYPDLIGALFSDALPEWACVRNSKITWDCFLAKRTPQECCSLMARQLEMIKAQQWVAWPAEGTLDPLTADKECE